MRRHFHSDLRKNLQPSDTVQRQPVAARAIGSAMSSGSSSQFLPPWLATYMASSRRLQTPNLSKVLRKWFLITCSVVPMSLPISRLIRPCQTRDATWISLGVKRSRGIMIATPSSQTQRWPDELAYGHRECRRAGKVCEDAVSQ